MAAGAMAQTGTWQSDQDPLRSRSVEEQGARDLTPEQMEARKSQSREGQAVVGLAAVRDPARRLTNLTVYSRGRDIGHVRRVEMDAGGVPRRIEIAFNDGASTAWVDAAVVDYDASHRLVTTGLDPGEIKALAATRFR
jgi:hypothetical protein